jgi:hypothetical protein
MCEGTNYSKSGAGRYWICDNGLCFLSEEEYNLFRKV